MRGVRRVVVALALVLGTGAAARADEQAVIQRIVDKAIQAAGGEAKLKKFCSTVWRNHSLVYGRGGVVESSGEYALDTLDHYRSDVTTTDHGQTSRRIIVVNGRKCWVNENGRTVAVPKSFLKRVMAGNFNVVMANNPANLKNRSLKLSLVDEVKIGDRRAVGITVAHPSGPVVTLYFDKEKGLVLKAASSGFDGDRRVVHETVYTYHREVQGVWIPFKASTFENGKLTSEMELIEIKMSKDRLDPKLFARP
jgi:hypothetical protein